MAMLKMSIPVRQRLANRKAGKPYLNETWPAYTLQPDKRAVYYVEDGALRWVGFADKLARSVRHKGWYCDEHQEDTMRGVVYALPGKNGERRLVAGYYFNGGDDNGCTFDFSETYDNEIEAAGMADEHARVAADREREWQEEENAKLAEEEAEEARLQNLADCHPPLYVE